MRYLLVLLILLGACDLDGYVAPDGSWWPSIAAYEREQGTLIIEIEFEACVENPSLCE